MKKILFFGRSFPDETHLVRGVFVVYRLKELIKRGLDIVLYRPTYRVANRKITWNTDRPIPEVLGLGKTVRGTNYVHITKLGVSNEDRRLRQILRREKPDLVHVHFVTDAPRMLKIAKAEGVPFVVTAHGSDIHTWPHRSPENKTSTLEVLHNADHVIFVSHFLLSEARALGYSGERFSVIPNGIDQNVFYRQRRISKKRCVGFVGNLIEVKRPMLLPPIFQTIVSQMPEVEFVVIGDGELRASLEAEFQRLGISGSVLVTGRLPPQEVAEWMNKMQVLVLTSKNEGWPCVVLEALSCGTVVVGSANGGIPEAISVSGTVISDSETLVQDFSTAIVKYLRTPPEEAPLLARAAGYCWPSLVQQEFEIYGRVTTHLSTGAKPAR